MSRPTLPAIRAGAAKRTTCQKGKFQGITASTSTQRLVGNEAALGLRFDELVGQKFLGPVGVKVAAQGALLGFGAAVGQGLAHFDGHEAGQLVGPLAQ